MTHPPPTPAQPASTPSTDEWTDDAGTPIDFQRTKAILPLRWNASTPEGRDIASAWKVATAKRYRYTYITGPIIFTMIIINYAWSFPLVFWKSVLSLAFVISLILVGREVYYGVTKLPVDKSWLPNWLSRWRSTMLLRNRCPACAYPFSTTSPANPPTPTPKITRCTECGHQWYLPSPTQTPPPP